MATFVPLAAAPRVLEAAARKCFCEDFVDGAAAKRLAAQFPHGRGTEAPLGFGDFEECGRGVKTGQHQIGPALDQRTERGPAQSHIFYFFPHRAGYSRGNRRHSSLMAWRAHLDHGFFI